MPGYPVIWKAPGEPPVAGRLHLGPSSVVLDGGERGSERRIELPYTDLVGLSRSGERLGRLAALRFDGDGFGTFLVAAFGGVALNSEILDELQTALASLF